MFRENKENTIYKIFSSPSIEGLEEIVNQKLKEGWELVGGISSVPSTAFALGALKNIRADVVLNLEGYNYVLLYLQALQFKGE